VGDIGMVEKALYFNLPDELINKAHVTFKKLFGDFLYCTDEIGCLMPELD
jgi:hypothetical protein